jgi:hypothetical protein
VRNSLDWYKSSRHNYPVRRLSCLIPFWRHNTHTHPRAYQYDIHIIAFTRLFRIVNQFKEVFLQSNVPSGLNRWIDWRAVTLDYDRMLLDYRHEWAERFERDSDHTGE